MYDGKDTEIVSLIINVKF